MMISRVRKRQNTNFIFQWKNIFKLIFIVLFVVICYFVAEKLRQPIHFPIKQVKVYGVHNTDQQMIQTVLIPLVSKGFFRVDVEQIKEHVQQSPWVSKAVVQRVWPDQVLITLDERTPLARWNKVSLLSTGGELFTPDISTYSDEIPQFIGPDGEHIHMMQSYKKINSLLAPLHFKISRLELTPSMSWILTFDNGIKVSAGYKDVLTHIGHFVKVYSKIVGDRAADVDYIDLRYPNGLAVKWKSVT